MGRVSRSGGTWKAAAAETNKNTPHVAPSQSSDSRPRWNAPLAAFRTCHDCPNIYHPPSPPQHTLPNTPPPSPRPPNTTTIAMKLFSRTPSPISLEPPTPPPPPAKGQSVDSPPRRPRLRHGAPPFFECWALVRVNRAKPTLRFCTLSGAHLRYSAAPGHRVFPASLLVYGALVEDLPSQKIVIRRPDARITLQPETRLEHAAFLAELQHAARRSLHEDYAFRADLRPTAFGRVSRAVEIDSQQEFAVKVACKTLLSSRHVACTRKEAVVLLSMPEHDNVVSIADVYESARCVYLVTRAHDALTLGEVVSRRGSLCEADVAAIVKGLLRGLVHLRLCKVVHRLICPENVLLVPARGGIGTPLLANFELAVSAVDVEDWSCVLQTFKEGPWGLRHASYLAPEVAAGGVGGYEQDVWSVGILMHYLLVGCSPFEFDQGVHDVDQLTRLIAGARGMPSFSGPLWRGVTSVAKHLCASMLHADPRFRVTAESALKHPWLNM